MKCPECKTKIEPSGMCCNSGKDSGYQCYCEKCDVWWVETFDDRIIVDEFLILTWKRNKEGEAEKET